jgi:hypothetical protein
MVSALRAPRQADAQLVGRAERLDIKLHRGVAHARRVVGIELEVAVVRRGKGGDAAVAQIVQQRHGQRRAFLRVGAGAQLIEQHQAGGSASSRIVMMLVMWLEKVLRLCSMLCSSPMSA